MRGWNGMIAVGAVLIAGWAAPEAPAQGKPDPERAETFAKAKAILKAEDSFAAVEYVLGLGEARKVATRFFHLAMDFYWKEKDLRASAVMGRAGIQYCLMKAKSLAKTDGKLSQGLKGLAQQLAFNMASFHWPGWGEKGIVISEDGLRFGLDMAKLDLRLVKELKLGPKKLSTAHWMVGASNLALKRYDEAIRHFETAKAKAKEGTDADAEWMTHGYLGMAMILRGGKDAAEGRARFDEAVTRLKKSGTGDAKFYAKQLEDVLKAFSR